MLYEFSIYKPDLYNRDKRHPNEFHWMSLSSREFSEDSWVDTLQEDTITINSIKYEYRLYKSNTGNITYI